MEDASLPTHGANSQKSTTLPRSPQWTGENATYTLRPRSISFWIAAISSDFFIGSPRPVVRFAQQQYPTHPKGPVRTPCRWAFTFLICLPGAFGDPNFLFELKHDSFWAAYSSAA